MSITATEERELVAELSEAVVARVAPEELDLFDDLLAGYYADPTPPTVSAGHSDNALGFGLGDVVVAVTPAAAAAASTAIRFLVRASNSDGKTAETLKATLAAGSAGTTARMSLTPEQLRELRQVTAATAGQYGMDPARAEEMANAVLVRLMTGPRDSESPARVFKILFLAANPKDTPALRLDREVRSIDEALRDGLLRDRFLLEQQWAVRVTDLQEAFLRYEPDIVHFTGHGSDGGGLIVETTDGYPLAVAPEALTELFRILHGRVRCVVLNACYSALQAEAIAEQVECVVGMAGSVLDDTAIEFAGAFYQALAYGKAVKTAFDLGVNRVQLLGYEVKGQPQLLSKRNVADTLCFV